MALFAYRAVDAEGRLSNGSLDAANAIDLELRLRRLGLDLLTFETVKRSTAARTRNVSRTELITFCFHLSQLLKAGVKRDVADAALDDVYEQTDSLAAARMLAEKKAGSLKKLEPMVARRRLAGMLQRRGFDYETIKPVIDQVLGGRD